MLPRSAALELAAPTSCVQIPHFAPAQATALRRPSVAPKLVGYASGMQTAVSAPSEAQVCTSGFIHQVVIPKASFASRIGDLTRYSHAHCALAGIEQRSQPSSCPHRADSRRPSGWVSTSMSSQPLPLHFNFWIPAAPSPTTPASRPHQYGHGYPMHATGAMGARWPV